MGGMLSSEKYRSRVEIIWLSLALVAGRAVCTHGEGMQRIFGGRTADSKPNWAGISALPSTDSLTTASANPGCRL